MTYPVPANYTAQSYVEDTKAYGPNLQVISSNPKIALAGTNLSASQEVYYDYRGTHYNVKTLDTVIVKNGTAYSLEYRTEPIDFDKNLPVAKQMIDSFQFTN